MAALGDAERVAFHFFDFLRTPAPRRIGNLVTSGLNSSRGKIAEATIRLGIGCHDREAEIPAMLRAAVRLFVSDEAPEVRAMIIHHLPYFISRKLEFGWELFALGMEGADSELWAVAANCLYWGYHAQYERVAPYLQILLDKALEAEEPSQDDADRDGRSGLAVWARIASLSSLSGHIPLEQHLQLLRAIGRPRSWRAATEVWGVNANQLPHRQACLAGLQAAMEAPAGGRGALASMHHVFSVRPPIFVADDLMSGIFRVEMDSPADRSHYHPHALTEWLEATALVRPEDALRPLEQLAQFLNKSKRRLYDNGPIARTLTSLYREAEERETTDGGSMLARVVGIQDQLLAVGVHGLDDWLRAAERP
jgi:hypothetical protein